MQVWFGFLCVDVCGIEFDGSLVWGVFDGNIGYFVIDWMGGFVGGLIVDIEQDWVWFVVMFDVVFQWFGQMYVFVFDFVFNQGGVVQIVYDIVVCFVDCKWFVYMCVFLQVVGIVLQ